MTAPQEPPPTPAEEATAAPAQEAQQNPFLRLALELGPLIVFFIVNKREGILTGTAWFMGAMAISLLVSWVKERRIPLMPMVTAVFVGIFGGLTLFFEDETFIKLKPTILNTIFGVVLLLGLTREKYFLKTVFGAAFDVTDEGWRILTVRWGLFFFVLAALNEVVWRNFSSDAWVAFKVWGLMPLTMIFGICQLPVIQRHEVERPETKPSAES